MAVACQNQNIRGPVCPTRDAAAQLSWEEPADAQLDIRANPVIRLNATGGPNTRDVYHTVRYRGALPW